jgi:hypothetical protein
MTMSQTTQSDKTLLDRYQDYRTRRFLKHERKYANALPGWRNQRRRRTLVVGLSVTFVFMFAVAILCAFGLWWAPLLWLPACAAFFPMWIALQIVSGRRGDAPEAALDEYEIQQRNQRTLDRADGDAEPDADSHRLPDLRVRHHQWRRHRHGLCRWADGHGGAPHRWLHARDDPWLDQAIGRRRDFGVMRCAQRDVRSARLITPKSQLRGAAALRAVVPHQRIG